MLYVHVHVLISDYWFIHPSVLYKCTVYTYAHTGQYIAPVERPTRTRATATIWLVLRRGQITSTSSSSAKMCRARKTASSIHSGERAYVQSTYYKWYNILLVYSTICSLLYFAFSKAGESLLNASKLQFVNYKNTSTVHWFSVFVQIFFCTVICRLDLGLKCFYIFSKLCA